MRERKRERKRKKEKERERREREKKEKERDREKKNESLLSLVGAKCSKLCKIVRWNEEVTFLGIYIKEHYYHKHIQILIFP